MRAIILRGALLTLALAGLYRAPLISGANLHLSPRLYPKLLRCYRCILETKELGCVLGSDICLTAKGGGCLTTIIHNGSKEEIIISDCRSKDQLSECSLSLASPVPGFWVSSRCCLEPLCNSPPIRDQALLQNQDKNTSVVLDFLVPIPYSRVTTTPMVPSTSQTEWPSDYDS
ncbi:lymphocyte antigen 6 complex locus protein G5c [Dromiciops gliroides]|uniref:lymphocyte antigen 6 complex locus protein G5c n=1 Tax=Dromiciops gliroides TaxID=33562 RepID=UPI001CC7B8B8|nr:lymphocyte antigen 6 complex locus protein G5c [Dromiciops gliroides]